MLVHSSAILKLDLSALTRQDGMRRAIPPIAERADDLKQRLQREHDGRKHVRLQMRYLRVTGHAQTRQQVAALLGISRNTSNTRPCTRWCVQHARQNSTCHVPVT